MIFFDVIGIVVLFTLFALLHSILASSSVKYRLKSKLGSKFAFYRLFYNSVSLISLLFILKLSPSPDIVLYDLPNPYDLIIISLQIFPLFGLILTLKHINLLEFLGISQIISYVKRTSIEESNEFIISGPFKKSRNPLYILITLFLTLRPTMDLSYFVWFLCVISYFIIGAKLEERKLLYKFGVRYLEYKNRVSALLSIKKEQ